MKSFLSCCILFYLFSTIFLFADENKMQKQKAIHETDNLIQMLINEAENSDTVLVAPGIYIGTINFKGKSITLRSDVDGDPETHDIDPVGTILDGSQLGSVVSFTHGETSRSVLEGFTVTNGWAHLGGGIHIDNASPTIRNNIIRNNTALYGGGGFYCFSASPLCDCNFVKQNRSLSYGGGMFLTNLSSPLISNSMIFQNLSEKDGGGIYSDPSSAPLVFNDTLFDNRAWNRGGGVYCFQAEIKVINSILWDNRAMHRPQIYSTPTAQVSFSNIMGGFPGIHNIDANPLFKDPLNENFHLSVYSPCIDMGDNDVALLICTDFEGDCRMFNWVVDIGADEFHRPIQKARDIWVSKGVLPSLID